MSWTIWFTVPLILSGCVPATIVSSVASAGSAYWSYRAAQVEPVEVLARECEVGPVYLSRGSDLTLEDMRAVASHNAAIIEVCE